MGFSLRSVLKNLHHIIKVSRFPETCKTSYKMKDRVGWQFLPSQRSILMLSQPLPRDQPQDKSHLLSQGLAGSTIVFVFHHLIETTACSAHFFSISISKAAHDILWVLFSWGISKRFNIPMCPKLFALPKVYDSWKKKIHLFFFNGTQITAFWDWIKWNFELRSTWETSVSIQGRASSFPKQKKKLVQTFTYVPLFCKSPDITGATCWQFFSLWNLRIFFLRAKIPPLSLYFGEAKLKLLVLVPIFNYLFYVFMQREHKLQVVI